MILCKYTKINNAAYISHLDVLRFFSMAIRRKELDIGFSQGFNRHMLLFFNQPLPLGLSSECEYFCAESKEDAEKFKNELNSSMPDGIRVLKTVNVLQNPNMAANVAYAEYKFYFPDGYLTPEQKDKITVMKQFEITESNKGVLEKKDVSGRVYSLRFDGDTLHAVLGVGGNNLRADKFLKIIFETCFSGQSKDTNDIDVVKSKAFFSDGQGGIKDADFLFEQPTDLN